MPGSAISGSASHASSGSRRGQTRHYYRVAARSQVDESLFGGGGGRTVSAGQAKGAGFGETTTLEREAEERNRRRQSGRADGGRKETIQVVTKDLIRNLIVPSDDPSGETLILHGFDFERIKSAARAPTEEERRELQQKIKEMKDQALNEAQDRKVYMKTLDLSRKKNEKLNDLEEEEKVKGEALRQKATEQLQEQEDEIKQLNELILSAKCHVIRDAQLLEKDLIRKELDTENRRLDQMMEVERVNAIRIEEEIERQRKEERMIGALQIMEQIEENEQERLLDLERKDQENRMMKKYLDQLCEAEKREIDEMEKKGAAGCVTSVTFRDIRFPTRLEKDGSDSINDPDYSCVYVTVTTSSGLQGYGLTFTIGRGNEIVCAAVKAYGRLVVGRQLCDIFTNFGSFWQELVHEPQLRWLGPEKGVTHLALAAIINALWDLWARLEHKPVWKLLVDMSPEQLISVIDFRYITDALTKEEAIEILKKGQKGKDEREAAIRKCGYPAYTTSAGWLGYSDEKIEKVCKQAMAEGFTRFKVKVGLDRKEDERRVGFVRKIIGDDKMLMVDANQRWGVAEAVEWMKPLAKYNLTWIEEPTSPDDILGHAKISQELSKYSIGVATGEHCANRVIFKQLLQAKAIQFCQIDSCRMAGPNEILSVYLMAAKFGVPVCPHAGGVGLCELVQHLSIFDYISISKSFDKRVIEYVDHLHSHFVEPVVMKNACYQVPLKPGYSAEMKSESLDAYEYPNGSEWKKLFSEGTFYKHPDTEQN